MRIVIDTSQPMTETELVILQELVNRHGSLAESQKPKETTKKTGRPSGASTASKAEEDTTEDQEEATESKTPVKKTPAKKTPAKKPAAPSLDDLTADDEEEPTETLEELMEQAVELATDLMNKGDSARVKAALKTAGASKVTSIEDRGQAAKFLEALRDD